MAPAQQPVLSLDDHFLDDDVLDDLAELLGDELVEVEDIDYSVIFSSSETNLVSGVEDLVKPAELVVNSIEKQLSVVKSTSTDVGKKALRRRRAIERWLPKRARRVFLKRRKGTGSNSANRVTPNRSRTSGQFVKSTSAFVSITVAQNSHSDDECDEMFA